MRAWWEGLPPWGERRELEAEINQKERHCLKKLLCDCTLLLFVKLCMFLYIYKKSNKLKVHATHTFVLSEEEYFKTESTKQSFAAFSLEFSFRLSYHDEDLWFVFLGQVNDIHPIITEIFKTAIKVFM